MCVGSRFQLLERLRSMHCRLQLVAALAGCALLCPRAGWAAEIAFLRNGYELRCDHHAMVDGRLRLYLTNGETNYLERQPDEIDHFEAIADIPPPTVTPAQATPTTHAATTTAAAAAPLTPADMEQLLTRAGMEHNVDMDLLASIVKAESGGNVHAVSHAGARGLMQLMPETAATLGVADSFRPEENIRGGSTYIDALLARYHDNLALALAAYNAGPAAVDRYHGIPPYAETRAYVARVIHEFNRTVRARQMQASARQR